LAVLNKPKKHFFGVKKKKKKKKKKSPSQKLSLLPTPWVTLDNLIQSPPFHLL
jgi:hypothetical protein